jgi:hypothetical protein
MRANAASADGESESAARRASTPGRCVRVGQRGRAWPHPAITTRAGQWSRRLPRGRGSSSGSRGGMLCAARRLRGPWWPFVCYVSVACYAAGQESRAWGLPLASQAATWPQQAEDARSRCTQDARPARISKGTAAPRRAACHRQLGSPLPHLHRDRPHSCHICTGTGGPQATTVRGGTIAGACSVLLWVVPLYADVARMPRRPSRFASGPDALLRPRRA